MSGVQIGQVKLSTAATNEVWRTTTEDNAFVLFVLIAWRRDQAPRTCSMRRRGGGAGVVSTFPVAFVSLLYNTCTFSKR